MKVIYIVGTIKLGLPLFHQDLIVLYRHTPSMEYLEVQGLSEAKNLDGSDEVGLEDVVPMMLGGVF